MRQERRRYPRVPIYLEVEAKHNDQSLIKAWSFDISGGGMRLFLAERLLKGEVIELKINFFSIPPVTAHGEVVWTQEVEIMQDKFQTGIRFTDMESAGKAKIETFVRIYRLVSRSIELERLTENAIL